MSRPEDTKIVVVVRSTRLADLKARFATKAQAEFYIRHLGGDFDDYEREDETYQHAVAQVRQNLSALGRVQVIERGYLPNFVFGPQDVVVAIGQDGLVANTLKYLHDQPLLGVNPDPRRWDGKLLPFTIDDIARVMREVLRGDRPCQCVTLAEAVLNTGSRLYAVNDLFIGVKSHTSARYRIALGDRAEDHSSSGVIISTGLGSSGWFLSLLTGAAAIARAAGLVSEVGQMPANFPWDAEHLFFTVREPFPSKTTGTSLVFGKISPGKSLVLESRMGENGVIFSDGIEQDFLEFNSGTQATIGIADRKGRLVV
jgi:NAD kinase